MRGRALRSRLLLLLVLAAGAWLLLRDGPRHVDLLYDLQDEPRPVHVDVRIVAPDGRTAAALSWSSGGAAPDPMPHRPLLSAGEHRLHARLVFPDGSTSDIERPLLVEGEGAVIVHLP